MRLRLGQVAFSDFKGCHIPESLQGEAPKGQFLYAWNETSTIGFVLSIHQLSLENIPIGKTETLSVTERDAFIMIEIGERVDDHSGKGTKYQTDSHIHGSRISHWNCAPQTDRGWCGSQYWRFCFEISTPNKRSLSRD